MLFEIIPLLEVFCCWFDAQHIILWFDSQCFELTRLLERKLLGRKCAFCHHHNRGSKIKIVYQ